jgi:Tol biopolymer transport system component
VIDRRGGEAQQFTEIKGRLSYYEWSPDSTKMAMVIREEEDDKKPEGSTGAEKPKPIVIDRYAFKRDGAGYISGAKRSRIFLYDIATKKTELVTTENFDETAPIWSPDGKLLAFTSNRAADGDRVPNSDIWVVEAKAGSIPRKLTPFTGSDTQPVWSPDGKSIAYLTGSEHKMGEYNMNRLAIVPVDGYSQPALTAELPATSLQPMAINWSFWLQTT